MAEENTQDQQVQFLLSDFSTRLRDLDERNRLIKERLLLIGQNLISTKEELEAELKIIKKENSEITKDVKELKKSSKMIMEEMGNFAKREEVLFVERMLKDFQPLEFMRRKDVEELIDEKLGKGSSENTKQIKTRKTKE